MRLKLKLKEEVTIDCIAIEGASMCTFNVAVKNDFAAMEMLIDNDITFVVVNNEIRFFVNAEDILAFYKD